MPRSRHGRAASRANPAFQQRWDLRPPGSPNNLVITFAPRLVDRRKQLRYTHFVRLTATSHPFPLQSLPGGAMYTRGSVPVAERLHIGSRAVPEPAVQLGLIFELLTTRAGYRHKPAVQLR